MKTLKGVKNKTTSKKIPITNNKKPYNTISKKKTHEKPITNNNTPEKKRPISNNNTPVNKSKRTSP